MRWLIKRMLGFGTKKLRNYYLMGNKDVIGHFCFEEISVESLKQIFEPLKDFKIIRQQDVNNIKWYQIVRKVRFKNSVCLDVWEGAKTFAKTNVHFSSLKKENINLILNIIEHRLKVKIWNSDDLIEVDNLFVANGLKEWIAIDEEG